MTRNRRPRPDTEVTIRMLGPADRCERLAEVIAALPGVVVKQVDGPYPNRRATGVRLYLIADVDSLLRSGVSGNVLLSGMEGDDKS